MRRANEKVDIISDISHYLLTHRVAEGSATAVVSERANENEDEIDQPGVKILSKKEKEKLKKERDKVRVLLCCIN